MKVSHELPLSLMHYSYEWNDYDYCLPHLLDKYEQYKLFFTKSKQDKRFIIMDNGLFEGVTHTTEDLLNKIEWLQPDIFIVPDAWNDSTLTIKNAKHWLNNYSKNLPENTNLMAVCQGETIGQLVTTYQTLVDLGYKHIAINHSSVAYEQEYVGKNLPRLKSQMYGRMEFIRRLVEKDTIYKTYYHHLLGCSLPQEFMAYSDWNFINSCDTSNPILVGAEGVRYTDGGINFKPENKLEFYFEKDLEDKLEDIKFNVQKFKQYVK